MPKGQWHGLGHAPAPVAFPTDEKQVITRRGAECQAASEESRDGKESRGSGGGDGGGGGDGEGREGGGGGGERGGGGDKRQHRCRRTQFVDAGNGGALTAECRHKTCIDAATL